MDRETDQQTDKTSYIESRGSTGRKAELLTNGSRAISRDDELRGAFLSLRAKCKKKSDMSILTTLILLASKHRKYCVKLPVITEFF